MVFSNDSGSDDWLRLHLVGRDAHVLIAQDDGSAASVEQGLDLGFALFLAGQLVAHRLLDRSIVLPTGPIRDRWTHIATAA